MKTDIVLAIFLIGRDVELEIGMVYEMIEPMENFELVLPCFADDLWRVEWIKTTFHLMILPMHTTRVLSRRGFNEGADWLIDRSHEPLLAINSPRLRRSDGA
jgi:hypothetical protein